MRSIYTGFTQYGGKDTFFAGANTGRGFLGVYDTIADESVREHIYIIKGASGTGTIIYLRSIPDLVVLTFTPMVLAWISLSSS